MTRLSLLLVLVAACTSDPDGAESDTAGHHPDASVPDASEPADARVPELQPSNDVGSIISTGLAVTPPAGHFSTDLDCLPVAALGHCEVQLHDGAETCVCRMDALDIGDLRIVGKRGLVILAYDRVSIHGVLDVSADGATSGPGGGARYTAAAASGVPGDGGSYGTVGAGKTPANANGTVELIPLVGGMSGRDASSALGGGGGGTLQITARGHITVDGAIDASGGGGSGGIASR